MSWFPCSQLHPLVALLNYTALQSNGPVQPCFAKYVIEHQAAYDLSNDESAYLVGSMFGAGSDTVRTDTLSRGILANSPLSACRWHLRSASSSSLQRVFPRRKPRCRKSWISLLGKIEVCVWTGSSVGLGFCVALRAFPLRYPVPSFGDQHTLPQVTAFVLETYRWRPVSAGGASIFHL